MNPLKLTPDQSQVLSEKASRSENSSHRRRAQILLYYADGKQTAEISDLVGLSPSRVRYWKREFSKIGNAIFRTDGESDRAMNDGHDQGARAVSGEESVVSDAAVSMVHDLDNPGHFVNRELSLLEFQRRVLQEAQDKNNPLLERIKFLGILGSNLDEFFMVRVGGLRKQVAAGVKELSPDGMTPSEQLAAIRKVALELMERSRECFENDLLPELDNNGIHVLDYSDLREKDRSALADVFHSMIFPVLTPMAFDPGHPFPHISNLSLNLAIRLRSPEGKEHFARLKVPGSIPRLLPLKRSSGALKKDGTVAYNHYFIWVEQVIAAHLDALFPGMEILEVHPFYVTRNADMIIQELEADDLLETMEEGVRQRRFGAVIRLTIHSDMPEWVRDILMENLGISRNEVYVLGSPLRMKDLMSLAFSVERFDLQDEPFVPAIPESLQEELLEGSMVGAIRKGNILLHHPYDSFIPVIDFLEQAARDPQVLAIKMTLYRVGRDAPVVHSLLKARENGKQVTVLVELKARFDEESNIEWAKRLEAEGVHVVYGLLGLKTHSKIALVVRREGDHMQRYVHLSTGNYNAVTAKLYEDIGYFTMDETIGQDATHLFNFLTGYSKRENYGKLLVAPVNLRSRLTNLIREEAEQVRKGGKGHLIFKTNSLVDKGMIQELYKASQAGVEIDLIVRGICCLRPGIPGLSENIRVRSVVGRFLEHSRVYYFRNGGNEKVYLGSADLMPRNLDRRVEVVFPVEEENDLRYIRDVVLDAYLRDNVKARVMNPDGSYSRAEAGDGTQRIESQLLFLSLRSNVDE